MLVKNEGGLKAVKWRVETIKNLVHAFKEKQDNAITYRDKIVIVAKQLYRDLYSSRDIEDNTERGISSEEIYIPQIRK